MSDAVLPRSARFALMPILTLTVVSAWFAGILAASLAGVFDTPPGVPPLPILAAVVLPAVTFALLYRFTPSFRSLVLEVDLRPLILLHTFRMVGFGFLFLAAYGVLPWAFAVPAGFGDALAATGALVLAVALYSPQGAARRWVLGWNAFGIADFVIAVLVGTMTRSGELLHFAADVGSNAMGTFPLALIPGFVVPFYLLTHLVVLLQVRNRVPAGRRLVYS